MESIIEIMRGRDFFLRVEGKIIWFQEVREVVQNFKGLLIFEIKKIYLNIVGMNIGKKNYISMFIYKYDECYKENYCL